MSSLKWNDVDWPLVEQRVFRYQQRIYRAGLKDKQNVINNLQRRLITSFDAKLLAVRQVTTLNKGKRTPGVDKKVYDTPKAKMKLVSNLKLDGKASRIKRVEIPKPGRPGQFRPLGIPTVEDRAKQALCRFALEPEWEARFERNSYGFRPGRNCHDAIESVFAALSNKRQTPIYRKMVLKIDIEKCFDRINHDLLLDKINSHPVMKNQIKSWLEAGILKGSSPKSNPDFIIKNEMGTPQGGVISPLLANIALHGLLDHLDDWILSIPAENNRSAAKRAALSVIRYADDILVIHKDLDVIKKSKRVIESWLWENCKLTLNNEKTTIYNSTEGFEFLGFSVITLSRNGMDRLKIYPSRQSQARVLSKVREIIQRNKACSSYRLITLLRPILIGWSNYFKYSECQTVYSKIDHFIHQKIRAWVFRIDKRHGRQIVKERYFPIGKTYHYNGRIYQDNWILYGKEKGSDGKIRETFLPRLSWVSSSKWVKVKNTKSPFDGDHVYWATRMASYNRLPTRVSKLLKLQKGVCPYCQTRFNFDSIMEVDHIQPRALGGKDTYANLQLLHRHCHIKKTRTDMIAINAKKETVKLLTN
jgi:RNA-directed DNA polymerase